MTHQLTTLPTGVTVVTEAMPSVRSVALGMWIAVGSRDEESAEAGCSHFLEHLLFKGTATRSARDIAVELDAVGGELNAFTSKEHTCFYARVLDRDVALAFGVLADMIVDARNDGADVESERDVVLSELEIHFDTPDDLVHSDFARTVLGDHPLALETLGSEESVRGLDRDQIHQYYLDHYRPELLVVAAAGNVDHGSIVALADRHLGDLGRPGGQRPARQAPVVFGAADVAVRHRATEQVHLVLGVPGLSQRDDDRWSLRVLDLVLGGGMSSRLFQSIREERGLAYTTYSYASSFSDGGLFGAYVGTSPGNVDTVAKLLRTELDRVVDDLSRDEIERAKSSLAGQLVLSLDSTFSRMSRIGHQVVAGDEIVTVDEALAKISAVDLTAVRDVAQRLLSQPRDLAVVGPFAADERDRFTGIVQ